VNAFADDPWTGSGDALPSPDFASRQLSAILSGGLRDAYAGVLSESFPDELARRLARLDPADRSRGCTDVFGEKKQPNVGWLRLPTAPSNRD
jgi:hypothetical protein